MTSADAPTCPACRSPMKLALAVDRSGPRSFQCEKCDQPDPLKSDKTGRWLEGLRPPK